MNIIPSKNIKTILISCFLICFFSLSLYSETNCLAPQHKIPANLIPLFNYLVRMNNYQEDINNFLKLVENTKKPVILEIGCGNAKLAWKIAVNNPDITVLAIDKYE